MPGLADLILTSRHIFAAFYAHAARPLPVRRQGLAWQQVLRAASVVGLGALILTATTQAQAEGGDGHALVQPADPDSTAPQETEAAQQAETSSETSSEETPAKRDASTLSSKAKAAAYRVKSPNSKPGELDGASSNDEQSSNYGPQNPKSRIVRADAAIPTQAAKSLPLKDSVSSAQVASADEESVELSVQPAISKTIPNGAFRPLILRYASDNDVPFALADAIVRLESRYNPHARNGPNMGLTQINAGTARSLGYQGGASGLLDAETNLRYGLKYLAQAYRLAHGDVCGTILRYQFGHQAQTMTGASRKYCAKVKLLTAKAEE